MYLRLPKKITALVSVILLAVTGFFVSCQKELSGDGFTPTETTPDLSSKIASSVSGFVTDENNAAVQGATVQFGTSTASTDKYGYFEFSNVQVVKNAAVVTILKPGYFKGIKTYIAVPGKSAFFRIKLLPKTNQGNFDAAAGGTVTLANGLSITFPANAVKLASGGAYSGQVNVAAQWINPAADDIQMIMPGDLRGLDKDGFMRALTSYSMSATELTGAAGELLQVADGKKASVSFPIPAAATASAPASIPLWHFDELKGLWVEEGSATKNGAAYTGEVSHFSYWNCDLPNATVPLTFDVHDAAGNPVSNVYVNIVPTTNNSWSHAGGYTDSSGHVAVLVTADAGYTLSVYGDCGTWGNPDYTQNFSVGTTAVDLGVITLTGPSIAQVSGTVECSGSPLADAYVIMNRGYYNYRYPVNSDGTYSFTTTICNGSTPVTFVAENLSTMQSGTPLSFTLAAGSNTVPALSACVVNIDQFVNYNVDGTAYSASYPTDSLYHYVNTQSVPVVDGVYVGNNAGSTGSVNFTFTNSGISAGSSQTLTYFTAYPAIADSATIVSGAPAVNITEYGNVGEFIAGNFNCTVTAPPPSGTSHTVTCTFRVRRRQ